MTEFTDEWLATIDALHRARRQFSGTRYCDHCRDTWPCGFKRFIDAYRAKSAEVERLQEQNDGLYQATLMLGKERDELRVEVQRVRLAAAWAEGVIEEEWGGYGPPGNHGAWERFRAALDAPSTAWKQGSETPA